MYSHYNSLSLLAFLKHLKTSSDISYLKTLLQDTKQAKEAKDNPVTIRSVKEKATNTKQNTVPSAPGFCPVCGTVFLLCLIVPVCVGGQGAAGGAGLAEGRGTHHRNPAFGEASPKSFGEVGSTFRTV